MKPKKILSYFALLFLTLGASVTLGFLSFGGMFALLPMFSLAVASFFLSTTYEGEIYFQNIKGALNKLFQKNYLKRHLANEFLRENFPDTRIKGVPEFFKDYEKTLWNLERSSTRGEKKTNHNKLKDMEKWFAIQLFSRSTDTPYKEALSNWLNQNGRQQILNAYKKRHIQFHWVKAFSLISGLFMGLSTSYLMAESIAASAFLTGVMASSVFAGPMLILVSSLLISGGVAYALLTYNTTTDLINNKVLKSWYEDLKTKFSEGFSFSNLARGAGVVCLLGIAVVLTIATAGTWWTIAKSAQPLFSWMNKLPRFIMGSINPVVIAMSTLMFNLTNTYETYDELTQGVAQNTPQTGWLLKLQEAWAQLLEREHKLQIINPFRILLKLTVTPLRVVFFVGHLVSIGVTADRFPGIPAAWTTLLGILAEGFEDLHYFFSSGHEQNHQGEKTVQEMLEARLGAGAGHEHGEDIPARVIKLVFSPLYLLAITWDWAFSRLNRDKPNLSFMEACKKYQLFVSDDADSSDVENEVGPEAADNTQSVAWTREHALFLIEDFTEDHLSRAVVGREMAGHKLGTLEGMKTNIKQSRTKRAALKCVSQAANIPLLNEHRSRFFNFGQNTRTKTFLSEELPSRMNAAPAA